MGKKEKFTKGKSIKRKVLKTVQKIRATVIVFAVVLMGCSKGDGPTNPINEPDGKEINSGTNEGIGVTLVVKSMVPESPATLRFGEDVEVTYDYDITRSDGARIWVYPYSNGNYTPKFKYELSPKYTGKGTKTVKFSVTEGDSIVVDQLRIQIGTGGYTLLGTVFWDPLEDLYESVSFTFTN